VTMKPFVLAALVCAATAQAGSPSRTLQQLPSDVPLRVLAQTGDEDEEEEGGLPTPTEEERAAVGPPAPTTSPAADPRAQELVSGAPLYNPNVAVHIVQKKQFADRGRHELTLFPVVPQVNGKFTNHWGTAISYVYHLHENFGFQVTPQFNWYNTESAFNHELITKVREQAQAATSLLLPWGAVAGVEVAPIYGKFAWYENSLAQYSFIVTGGAGYGNTRHQLKPENEAGPATFGDTGNRFLGQVGAGFRVQLGNRFAVRLEVRDLVYTAKVDQVNGCDATDLREMRRLIGAGKQVIDAQVSANCQKERFHGVDENTEHNRSADVPIALSLVSEPSSDVLNLVSFYGGISFIF
jgi:outer membrane beta-barrel protein